MVRVDIGADQANANLLRRATILTETGPVDAVLVRTERVCQWLCGVEGDPDEGKACHYEADLRASKRIAVTTALVIKGDDGRWRLSVRDFDYAHLCAPESDPLP